MNYAEFRRRVTAYRRPTGRTQAHLARLIGLHPHVLSHKLHATDGSRLTHVEIKDILRVLASWQSFTTTADVVDLLALMDLGPGAFSSVEWAFPPFQSLGADVSLGSAASAPRMIPTAERSELTDSPLRVATLP
ncbi:MAG TPA: hypothetical protein VKT80_02215, partial [Chloroflexota bacterium]|nr:hypothetical protein [Chloroflexota bacterium]